MISRARSRGLPTTPIAAALLTTLLVGVTSAYGGTLTVAWDQSADPSVIGYYVYVGTTSGVYTEAYDVGNVTTFSYSAAEGARHYFAVAAYAAGPLVGPRSPEVTAFGSSADFWSFVWEARSTGSGLHTLTSPAGGLPRSSACWQPSAECVSAPSMGSINPPVTVFAASPDGRLFSVEGGRRLRVNRGAGLARESVLIAGRSTTLHHVAVDPTFAASGWIWVSETQMSADGRRMFAVVRYRVVRNRARERAEIVSGITLPPTGDALFAIGQSGHIYVAVPGSPERLHPYWGTVLRFSPDGSVPQDHRAGSPVIGTGYAFPHAITLDRFSERVWLSGVD